MLKASLCKQCLGQGCNKCQMTGTRVFKDGIEIKPMYWNPVCDKCGAEWKVHRCVNDHEYFCNNCWDKEEGFNGEDTP